MTATLKPTLKPTLNPTRDRDRRAPRPKPEEGPGYFILSLDLELAWGVFAYDALEAQRPYLVGEREVIRHLLDLLDRYRIPATWATVGHLFLDSCQRSADAVHPDVLRPTYPLYGKDWHHLDPCTDVASDPLWYGPDIIDEIVGRPTAHEMGTHTFSHIVVGDPACTREEFRSQLRACRDVHEARGLGMRSIVYPNNRIGHLDVLAEEGVVAYRGNLDRWYTGLGGRLKRLCYLADYTVAATPPTYPTTDRVEGPLVNLPASMFLLPRDGVRRAVPLASRRQQALRGVRRAVERGEIFHLWFHPFNLATDPGLLDVLDRVFSEIADHTAGGRMVPITMGGLADQLLHQEVTAHPGHRLPA
jgi:peptidoglycan/xylan/chitin deacetylase (PgdA/CDA1 family)